MRKISIALSALVLLPAGCSTLGDLQENQCGNLIVELDNHEDCDTLALGADGKPAEHGTFKCSVDCRVQCTFDANGNGSCPDGWGCGTDGICRRPTGTFGSNMIGQASVDLTENLSHMLTGDLDGDGRQDVVVDTGSDVRVHFFDGSGALTQTVAINAPNGAPALGDFDGDGVLDLAYRLDSSVAVRLGTTDRSLPAVPFPVALPPSFKVNTGDGLIAVDVHALDGVTSSLRELLRVEPNQIETFLPKDPAMGTAPDPLFSVGWKDLPNMDVRIRPAVGFFDKTSPCQQFAFPNATQNRVEVYYPCRLPPPTMANPSPSLEWNDTSGTQVPPMEIALPLGLKLAGPIFAHDVDRDGNLDVVVYAKDSLNNRYELLVAYGYGTGDQPLKPNFSSTPPGMLGPQDGKAGHYLCLTTDTVKDGSCITDPPLAVADFNGDGALDVVNPCGLYETDPTAMNPKGCGLFGKLTPVLTSRQGMAQAQWSSARAVDLNADGRVDLVTASCADTSLTYYEHAGNDISGFSVFNTFSIPTTGGVDQMVVGDFDGDLVPDIVFAQRATPLVCSNPDDPTPSDTGSLGAVFGAKSGGPSAVSDLGVLSSIGALVPGNLTSPSGQYDLVTDLVVLSKDEHDAMHQAFDVFTGSTARALVAPHFLVDKNGPADPWLITMAPFSAGAADDGIAVLARQVDLISKKASVSLYLLGSSGYDLDATGDVPFPAIKDPSLYSFSDVRGAWTAGVDLGGDNGASIAVLLREDATTSSIYPVSKAAGGWPTAAPGENMLPGGYRGPLLAADMDGDGNKDLLAVSDGDVIVIWNAADGSIDVGGALHIKDQLATACSDAPDTLQAIGAVQGAPGKGRQLVVLAKNHAYLVTQDPSDAMRRTFAAATCLDASLEGFYYPNKPDYTGTFINTGDVDGDGVEDLVIGKPGQILVFAGIAVVQ